MMAILDDISTEDDQPNNEEAPYTDDEHEEDFELPPSRKTLDCFFDEETWSQITKPLQDFNEEDMKSLVFQSLKGCSHFYSIYAQMKGFGVRHRSPRSSVIDGHPTSCTLLCAAQGSRDEKWLNLTIRQRKSKAITRFNCQAHIRFKWLRKRNIWVVYRFKEEHSHTLVEHKHVPFIRSHRKIKEADRIFIADLYFSGVKPSTIMRNYVKRAGGHKNVGFGKDNLYTCIHKIKTGEVSSGDVDMLMAFLLGKQSRDSSFFINYTCDQDNRLEKLFWCDGKSRRDYQKFGNVLAFDTTYKTNNYKLPLVILIGVNHHMRTVPFGCALISDEKESSYIWVLEQLLAAGSGRQPCTVLTDRDMAMANAIKVVMPKARHRLCLWHLMRNVRASGSTEFANGFMKCVNYRRPSDFEKAWKELVTHHHVQDAEWAINLYNQKHKWAEAYLRGHFFAGMRSTQRCENVNAKVKIVLDDTLKLYRFIQLCDQSIEDIRNREDEEDYKTIHTQPVITGVLSSVKSHAASLYTRNTYHMLCKEMALESLYVVKKEISESNDLERPTFYWLDGVDEGDKKYLVIRVDHIDKMFCCCLKLESVGFPCRHMFAVMKYAKMKQIPSGCVYKRWTIHVRDEDHGEIQENVGADESVRVMARFAYLSSLSSRINRAATKSIDSYNEVKEQYAKILEGIVTTEEDMISHLNVTKETSPTCIVNPKIIESQKGMMKKARRACSKCQKHGHDKRTCPSGGASALVSPIVSASLHSRKNEHDSKTPNESAQYFEEGIFKDTSSTSSMSSTEVIGEYLPNTYVDGDVLKGGGEYNLNDLDDNPFKYDWDPNKDNW